MLFTLTTKVRTSSKFENYIKNITVKSIVAELNNVVLERLFFTWLNNLKHPFNKAFVQNQVNELNKFPIEVIEQKIKKGIEFGYGTLIFRNKKENSVNYNKEVERLKNKVF